MSKSVIIFFIIAMLTPICTAIGAVHYSDIKAVEFLEKLKEKKFALQEKCKCKNTYIVITENEKITITITHSIKNSRLAIKSRHTDPF